MSAYLILGMLSAFGLLSAAWALLGWLLPSGKGMLLVCVGMPDPGMLSRWRWLRGIGVLSCPLIAVAQPDADKVPQDIEICSREELIERLKWETDQKHGTGTGNPSGRSQRCDLSEL